MREYRARLAEWAKTASDAGQAQAAVSVRLMGVEATVLMLEEAGEDI